jgi:hypothetical protein
VALPRGMPVHRTKLPNPENPAILPNSLFTIKDRTG